jgi:hypothetical protein
MIIPLIAGFFILIGLRCLVPDEPKQKTELSDNLIINPII